MSRTLSPLVDLRSAFDSLSANLSRFNARSVQTQLGRSILALSQLLTLTLTDWRNLTAQVLGRPPEAYCEDARSISLFCLGAETPNQVGRWLGIVITLIVLSGVFPRYTAVLHAWLALSMNVSLSLPDGGEPVVVFSTALLVLVLVADDRPNGWSKLVIHPPRAGLAAVSYAAYLALCLQLAGIYLESGLAKLAVEDWVNGSAMFYIVRDPMFGAIGALGDIMQWFTALPVGTALLTWGTILLECTIAVLCLSPSHFKKYALVGVLILHLGIAITMGLWSFALAMIGTATVAAYRPLSPAAIPRGRLATP